VEKRTLVEKRMFVGRTAPEEEEARGGGANVGHSGSTVR
jgi:hypothetical protein